MEDHYATVRGRVEGLRRIEESMREIFCGWAYDEVSTPILVDYEVLKRGNGTPADTIYKLIGEEGEVLALRADMTAPLAQLAASEWERVPRPLRLSYVSSVFRRGGGEFGARELVQAGVELIGLAEPEADAEVIALACEVLRRSGLDQFQISLGHNGLLRELLAGLELGEVDRAALRDALIRRDFVVARRILGSGGGDRGSLIEAFSPFGSERSLEVLASMGIELPGLQRLREVVQVLGAYGEGSHLRLDVSLARGFNYYTGVVFEIYCPSSGLMLGGGGRYDGLTGAFGAPEAATGFALDLDRVLSSLPRRSRGRADRKWLVIGTRGRREEILACARRLRRSGHRAAVHWMRVEREDGVEDVAENMGFSGVALLRRDGELEFRRVSEERVKSS